MQFRRNSYTPKNGVFLRQYITNFDFNIFDREGEIFALKIDILWDSNNFHWRNNFPAYFENHIIFPKG